MPRYELAQLNIATVKAPLDSPVMAEFVANLDAVNALAEAAPGFVWRLKTEDGNATALRPLGEQIIVNLSVWEDVAALHGYVYASGHAGFMRRRREWFERMAEAFVALWWVPAGHRPTVEEALERLAALRRDGPTPAAFTFRQAFPPPDAGPPSEPASFDAACPAT